MIDDIGDDGEIAIMKSDRMARRLSKEIKETHSHHTL